MLDEEHPLPPNQAGDDNIYVLGRIDQHNVVMTCLPGHYGTNNAAIVATNLKRSLKLFTPLTAKMQFIILTVLALAMTTTALPATENIGIHAPRNDKFSSCSDDNQEVVCCTKTLGLLDLCAVLLLLKHRGRCKFSSGILALTNDRVDGY
jgi:hypothetical protein